MVFVLMTAMVVLGMVSMKGYKPSLAASLSAGPDHAFKSSALAIFACIGIPQAVRRSTRVLFCIGLDCAR
jgi:solute carrier family 45 protein 1/2/4